MGGYVCHDTFDHTSVLRLLERVTGVTAPNISAWRRKTVGDLTAALGTTAASRIPRLPATAAQLKLAEEEVKKYGLPPSPGSRSSLPSAREPSPSLTGRAATARFQWSCGEWRGNVLEERDQGRTQWREFFAIR